MSGDAIPPRPVAGDVPSRPTARPRSRPTNGKTDDAFPPFQPTDAEAPGELTADEIANAIEARERHFPEPEDRGTATLSALGEVAYVEDLIRPGRIIVMAAEEGTAKTHAANELAIRLAVAGGSFAGTWPVLRQGPVLILSEQHADDDYEVEQKVLGALELDRAGLEGGLYRLSLMTAAGGVPALDSDDWRTWIVEWMRERGILLVIFDTASGATAIDPWGEEIRALFRRLRLMLSEHAELSIILAVHLKKPQGRGQRRISDVLGEWARWADVLLLMEADGLTRVRLTSRKRVRYQRAVVVTKAGGLLVDPVDADAPAGPKVPQADVMAAVRSHPGSGYLELAGLLGVSKDTAGRYAAEAEKAGLVTLQRGANRAWQVFATDADESENELLGQLEALP